MPELTFNFLDMGQGDGTYITFPDGSDMLIDLGSLKNSSIIKPEYLSFFDNYWKGKNNALDTLIITHGDKDHYNQIVNVFAHYKLDVTEIYITGEVDDYKAGEFNDKFLKPWNKKKRLYQFADNDSTGKKPWKTIGGVKIYLLQANFPSYDATNTNDKSAVLLFEYMGNKMVMGGDATKKTEKEIIRYYDKDLNDLGFLQCDYMKVNHHGSETSSCVQWVKAVKPKYAFISADMDDGYLHPRCTIIERILADGNIDTTTKAHPYVCYEKSRDDWKNNKNKNAIYNTLAKYEKRPVLNKPVKKKPVNNKPVKKKKPKVVNEVVTAHGLRYSLIFEDTGTVTLENSGSPTLILSEPDSGRHGL